MGGCPDQRTPCSTQRSRPACCITNPPPLRPPRGPQGPALQEPHLVFRDSWQPQGQRVSPPHLHRHVWIFLRTLWFLGLATVCKIQRTCERTYSVKIDYGIERRKIIMINIDMTLILIFLITVTSSLLTLFFTNRHKL